MANALPKPTDCCNTCCALTVVNSCQICETSLVFENMAALRANTNYWNDQVVDRLGYATRGDGNGMTYYFDSTSLAADDDGSVVRPTSIPVGSPGRYLQYV